MWNKTTLLIIIATLLLAASCSDAKVKQTPTLSVTNQPQKYFLEKIVGDKYKVNAVIAPGVNPESMDLAPSQLLSLSQSVAYFKIGFLDIENILVDKVTANNTKLKIVECSHSLDIIKDDHIHADGDSHQGHAHGDPHYWSSTQSAKIIATNMYNAMLELDSANANAYKVNYDILIDEIAATDSIVRDCLSKADSKSFIIYHPALSYFARDYGLTQLSIENEGKSPSPSQLKELIDRAKKENIKVVFIQKEYDVKNAETVAGSIKAKAIPIDLLSYDWCNEMILIAKAIANIDE